MIVDLEGDISTSPYLVELLIEDETSKQLYAAISQLTWYKLRDVTKSEEAQVIDVLMADREDPSRRWSCSPRYAFELIVALRAKHHNIETRHVFMYSDPEKDISPEIIQCLTALGWIPYSKTPNN